MPWAASEAGNLSGTPRRWPESRVSTPNEQAHPRMTALKAKEAEFGTVQRGGRHQGRASERMVVLVQSPYRLVHGANRDHR